MSIVLKIGKRLRFLRFTPFDSSTEEGRSNERHRRIALSALAGLFGKLTSMLVPLVTIPITLSYLGGEKYGIWMTLTSLTASLTFADLGIGLGLLNLVSECNGQNDRKQAAIYISSAFFMLLGLAVTLGLIYYLFAPHVTWTVIFHNLSPTSFAVVPTVMGVFIGCFLLNLPLSVVSYAYLGYQEGFTSSIAQISASVVTLITVVLIVKLDLGLTALVLANSGLPILGISFNGYRLFVRKRPWLTPRISLVEGRSLRRLMQTGFLFFVLQVCVAACYSSDNLIISSLRGPKEVADYSVASKLFGIVLGIIPIILAPVWPALTEAANRGDVDWVRSTLRKSSLAVLGFVLPTSILLLVLGKPIIDLWTHHQVHNSNIVMIALACWTVIGGVSTVNATFLNAMNVMKFQVIACSIAAAINLAISISLTKAIGPAGVVIGSSVSSLLLCIPVYVYAIPHVLKTLNSRLSLVDSPLE